MPLYEYRCRSCGERFEISQAFTDDPITTCHVCGGTVKRVVGRGTGVIFKGSGFYVTDTRSANSAAPKASNGTSSAESKSEAAEKAGASGD
ncbi:MAG: zinc ribbon domain-containing protein [Chloroflexota bacterium]|nr:MAG: zinc ribbon domain-containing protein [Chloroflexota bacterium]